MQTTENLRLSDESRLADVFGEQLAFLKGER